MERGIHFRRSHPAPGTWAWKAGKGGWQGEGVFAGASNQILLMKWENIIKPAGAETTDILSYVS